MFCHIGKNTEKNFFELESLRKSEVVLEVLYKKYDHTMDNDYVIDYGEWMYQKDFVISKKRTQYIEMIPFNQKFIEFFHLNR